MQAKLLNHGLGDILNHPSAQIISSAICKETIDMQYETEDPQYKANEFTVTFSGYRTPQVGIDPSVLPKRFRFKFRFFTFDEETTDQLALVSDGNISGKPKVERNTPYFLQRVDANSDPTVEVLPSKDLRENIASCKFLIDPSKSRIKDEYARLARYLKDRYLTIDVYDAVSHFFFGSCKIPLYELIRGREQVRVRPKDCEIFNPHTNTFMGHLHVILKNEGKPESVAELVPAKEPTASKKHAQPTQAGKTRKKILSRPMDNRDIQEARNLLAVGQQSIDKRPKSPDRMSNSYNAAILSSLNAQQLAAVRNNPELNKKLRVDRIKRLAFYDPAQGARGSMADPQRPDWEKLQALKEIEVVRQTKKELVMSEVMGEYMEESEIVHMTPGEISFVRVQLHNTTQTTQAYRVVIDDPDVDFDLKRPEVRMVHSASEQEHWVTKREMKKPNNYGQITGPNDVMLGTGQSIELLFVCQTFRDIVQGAK